MSAGETVLRASSVSTAIDEATASSSSTPSTEGLQDHIESLLQRLPDDLTLPSTILPFQLWWQNYRTVHAILDIFGVHHFEGHSRNVFGGLSQSQHF